MPDARWDTALDWQAYLKESTAGVRGNAAARNLREELRAHLEAERRRLAGQGLPPEEAAHAALAGLGDVSRVRTAIADRHREPDWRRAQLLGTVAGAVGGLLYPTWPVLVYAWSRVLHRLGSGQGPWGMLPALVPVAALAVFAVVALGLIRSGSRAGLLPIEGWTGLFAVIAFSATVWIVAHALALGHIRYLAIMPVWPTGLLSPATRGLLAHVTFPTAAWGAYGLTATVSVWYAKGVLGLSLMAYAQGRRGEFGNDAAGPGPHRSPRLFPEARDGAPKACPGGAEGGRMR